jgi:serine/threonine protein phosphatase PrpC
MTLRLNYAVRSHVGHVRDGNEDSAYAGSRLVAVADGMGGHAAGEVASSTTISALAHLDDDAAGGDLLDALGDALVDANDRLRELTGENAALEGMGTTVTALLSDGTRLAVAHIGDSRIYLLRDGEFSQLTHDHTLVQELVDTGRITADQATSHPQRALLTRALDGRDLVSPDLSVREARLGDRFLLCTDGLSTVVSEETMAEALAQPEPQNAADRLVELALKGGGPDNVTVVVADVVDAATSHPDAPVVAGAAAERGAVAGAAVVGELHTSQASAASRARRIALAMRPRKNRPAEENPVPDLEPEPKKPRRLWIPITIAAAAIVIVAGVAGTYTYLQTQWYVGIDSGKVTVFRGIHGNAVGVSLHSVDTQFMSVEGLPDFEKQRLDDGIPANSRSAAVEIVDRLRMEQTGALSPGATPSGTPTPRVTATPTHRTSPSATSTSPAPTPAPRPTP